MRNQKITISGCKYNPILFENVTALNSFEYYELSFRNETSRLEIFPNISSYERQENTSTILEFTITDEENGGLEKLGEYRCLVYDPDTMRSPVYSKSVTTNMFRE